MNTKTTIFCAWYRVEGLFGKYPTILNIYRELVAWPWPNLASSQGRPYCASVKSHCLMGLVSRQWDAGDRACALCDCRIHTDGASKSASSRQSACPFCRSPADFFFGKASRHPGLSANLQPRFGSLRLLAFPKAKIAVDLEEICEGDGHTTHQLSQRRLTAEWLAPREGDCSRMSSKVFSNWLPRYIKATRLVLEIFKIAGYFPDSPRMMQQLLEYKLRVSRSIEFEDDWLFRRIETLWIFHDLHIVLVWYTNWQWGGLNWLNDTLGVTTVKTPG